MPTGKWFIGCSVCLLGVAAGALGAQSGDSLAKKPGAEEEKVLQAAKVDTDNESLLNYLKARTLKEEDRQRIEKLISSLDSNTFSDREKATKQLKELGRPALPFLKKVQKNPPSLEVLKRAEGSIRFITDKISSEPIAEIARLLAVRDAPGAIEVLLNYVPHVDEPFIEEEVLTSLSKLAIRGGKIDPQLLAALKDSRAEKRAAAVYILAQRADPGLRELVRPMLIDNDPMIQSYAAAGLIGKQSLQTFQESLQGDLTTLSNAKVETNGAALVKYLEQRILSEDDQKLLHQLIVELGDELYTKRANATRALIAWGKSAIPFLRVAAEDADKERKERAANAIKAIQEKNPPTPVPSAVCRILAAAGDPHAKADLKPAEAIKALLHYVPFAEDDSVEDEVINALTILCVREAKVPSPMVTALDDPLPARRAAAAAVLGKVGTRAHADAVRKLLNDPFPKVQFRAAQGLIAAQDKTAFATLVELLGTASSGWVWQVEEQLSRIAGETAPLIVVAADAPGEYRKQAAIAWAKWWEANEAKVDLAGLQRNDSFLGVFTITEFDSNVGNRQGRVWECGRDGRQRWEVPGLAGGMDGQLLANGRVLVTENNFSKVSERDMKGAVVWSIQTPGPPIAAQRLANGNTFIAMYDRVMEVTPERNPVYTVNKGPNLFIYGACRMRNGHVAVITAQGQIVVFDPIANRDLKTIQIGQVNGWAGIDALPNGNFLISTQFGNQIREVDDTGKVHWQATFPGVFRAYKLPNGNVIACSMTTKRVAELDRNGGEVWGVTCQGRPWSVRFR